MDSDYITIKAAIDCAKSVLLLSKHETNALNRYIRMMPAVRIIRCRECRFNTTEKKCLNSDSIIKIPSDNDFCSYGQSREDGDGDG